MWSGEALGTEDTADTATAHLRTLVGHGGAIHALAIGPNGNVYSGSSDTTIRVWNGLDGTHLQTLTGHTRSVMCLAVVAQADKVYSGGLDRTIRVWSTTDGQYIQTLVGHTDAVLALATGPDDTVFSASPDKRIHEWSTADGSLLRALTSSTVEPTGFFSVVVGPDGTLFGGSGRRVHVWKSDEYRSTLAFKVRSGGVVMTGMPEIALAMSPDGTLYTGLSLPFGGASQKHIIHAW